MKTLVFTLLCSFCLALYADCKPLIPYPQKIHYSGKKLKLGNKLNMDEPDLGLGSFIEIHFVNDIPDAPLNKEEAYELNITENKVHVSAISETGIYRGLQTLKQLYLCNEDLYSLPVCEITDWPAFRIRGFMQDVGRTYISMNELKTEIDLLSRFKINVFHWHLTENQAWRLESKIYPQLNAPENMTRMPGSYYTLQEAKELVEFCKQRHVMLIPEIDMPGHSAAFVNTFHTDMQSPEGMKILKDLLKEVCRTFDVPYIHIGTDEVKFTNPQFVPEMVAFVREQGKKVISWNPGWEYRPGEIDMTQLWSYRGKEQPGIPAIDCRYHYLNHFDNYADLISLYNSRVCNRDKGSDDIAGGILAIWNDRYVTDEKQIVAENNLYAHMLAFAERSWRGGGYCYFDGKETLLRNKDSEIYRQFANFEERMLWHKQHTFKDEPFPYVKQSDVEWLITDAFPNGGDVSLSFPPEQEEGETFRFKGKTYRSHLAYGAGIYLRHVWGTSVPGFYAQPEENHTAYAGTWVYSSKEQQAGLFLEFQNYSRSESDLPPLPGTWDYKGSRAWLNGKEIQPPCWKNNHKIRSNEIPLANENAVSRPPLQVTLQKGWNRLLLKLPVTKFSMPETRLVKWMFNAVFVTPDGKKELDGITYSAQKRK